MMLRLRKPDRRGFKSTIHDRRKRQREYYYASMSVLVVKIVLFVFLWILFYHAYRVFSIRFEHLPPSLRYAVPAVIAIFAIVLAYFIFKNIKEISASSKERYR